MSSSNAKDNDLRNPPVFFSLIFCPFEEDASFSGLIVLISHNYPEDYHLWSSGLWSLHFKRALTIWRELVLLDLSYDSYFEGYLFAEIRMYWPYDDCRIIENFRRSTFSLFSQVMKIMFYCNINFHTTKEGKNNIWMLC